MQKTKKSLQEKKFHKTILHRFIKALSFFILTILYFNCANYLFCQSQAEDRYRFGNLDFSVVKIFVDDESFGSGFVIDGPYLITNFHVVEKVIEAKRNDSKNPPIIKWLNAKLSQDKIFAIEDYPTAEVLNDFISNDTIYYYGKASDLIVLKPNRNINLHSKLPLSKQWMNRGDKILVAGFPLGLEYMTISSGIIGNQRSELIRKDVSDMLPVSAIFRGQGDFILAAGGSGGPVVKIGKTISKDSVIGIAVGGKTKNAKKLKRIYDIYDNKLDSIIATQDGFNPQNKIHSNYYEKYLIFSSFINSNVQIPEFIHVSHLRDLLDLLEIEH
ncbi:S1 family peptidase [Flagellimonas profundi]|uniref:Trypsin-like peptidase domain-containing protein n=1 Tax=Flagellimonas profundi TaxID=2915620 RepID=A0ABS3FIU9_9FLAO|nr:serine protease [Allomuricauda profundi]MBO0342446.1 trypsin-like peptidase domain-containing protein [Allomuricauda profundi]